jgi:hypothetical protein
LCTILPHELRVLSRNLWHGGTKVDGHRAEQLKVILDTEADAVGLQQTNGTAARELAEALGWHHHTAGQNLGVISRHPITVGLGDPGVGFYGAAGARIRIDEAYGSTSGRPTCTTHRTAPARPPSTDSRQSS